MKILLLLLTFLATTTAFAESLPGKWFYYKKVYREQEMPEPPEATLRLFFEFTETGESRLYWWHEGQNDHCERRGRYYVEGEVLVDQVTWVDPKNTYGCSSDPDMRLGRVTRTLLHFSDRDLWLNIGLGNESLFYVWKRVENE